MYQSAGKRAFDLVLGLGLILVALPVIAVCAVGSAVAFRTWPIFVQPRLGRDGREFRFIKLRSLPRSTPRQLDKNAVKQLAIPRWGRFLRRFHLDELPELMLVPLGRMSLVGPRPEMPEIAARYSPDFLATRLSVRPGCTGLWQVSEAVEGMIYEAPEYDSAYVANVSARLDAWILLKTVSSTLFGRQIGSLDEVPGSLLPNGPGLPAGPTAQAPTV